MDAAELARWTRFAAKGGIGKCTAVSDCVAESAEDLMFLKDDEITVLMQVPEKLDFYLGYCEGVVGRFHGRDVHFHSRLKKPVMTKRSSVTASATLNSAHSPSPTLGVKTGSPMPHSESPSTALFQTHRRGAVMQMTPRTSLDASATSSLQTTPTSKGTPATAPGKLGPEPNLGEPEHNWQRAALPLISSSSPIDHTPPILPSHISSSSVSSTSTLVSDYNQDMNSEPRGSATLPSLAHNTSSLAVPTPPTQVQAIQSIPQPPLEPPSLNIDPELNDNLRARDRLSLLPVVDSPLDTSVSTYFDTSMTSRISLALSDGEVGIGLSLLQDLADGGGYDDWSDSDSEGDAKLQYESGGGQRSESYPNNGQTFLKNRHQQRRSSERRSGSESGSSEYSVQTPEGHRRQSTASSESQVDGLGYEDTETGHSTIDDHTSLHNGSNVDDGGGDATANRTPNRPSTSSPPYNNLTFPPIAPLSPSRSSTRTPQSPGSPSVSHEQYSFPAPPTTHTSTHSLTQDQLDTLASLRERRPSLAPSATSALSTGTGGTSDWEGASDIYDDYRYSRFSMGAGSSRMSFVSMGGSTGRAAGRRMSAASRRTSVSSSKAGGPAPGPFGGGDYPVFVDNPEARSRVDSATSRPSGDSSTSLAASSLRVRAGSGADGAEPMPTITSPTASSITETTADAPRLADVNHLNVRASRGQVHSRDASLAGSESDASIYTQSSIGRGSVHSTLDRMSSAPFESTDVPPPVVSQSITPSQNFILSATEQDGLGRRIVVEDEDEPLSPPPYSTRSSLAPTTTSRIGMVVNESPSPEPEVAVKSKTSLVVANRTPSPSSEEELVIPKEQVAVEPPSPLVPSHPQFASLQTSTASSALPLASHLRPSLSELRGGQPDAQGQRRSLFLPHPNAPKAPDAHSPGPMYIAQPQTPPLPQQVRDGAIDIIKVALSGPPRNIRGPTIYGRTTEDLAAAHGPVPMIFSLDPPAATAPPESPAPVIMAPPPAVSQSVRASLREPATDNMQMGGATGGGSERPSSLDQRTSVIPRANFFPRVGGARPRSRSFSGFNSTTTEIPLPIQRSREEGSEPLEMPTATEIKQSLTPHSQSTPGPIPGKPAHRPSPLRSSALSLPHNPPTLHSPRPMKPPSSPLASGFTLNDSVPASPTTSSNRPVHNLRTVTSRTSLNQSPPARSFPVPRTIVPGHEPLTQTSTGSPLGKERLHESLTSLQGRPSLDTDTLSVRSSRSNVISPPPTVGRHNSLRTKLSLPNLRRNFNRQDDPSSPVPGTQAADSGTMQVKDMDFELVRPNISQFQAARSSEDSGVMGRDGSVDARQDHKLLRNDSPATTGSAPRSPTAPTGTANTSVPGSPSWPPVKVATPPVVIETESSMDAHRQRELKWVSVMSVVPPSQSKKSKKVKKLVLEGVPSSVRYLVWTHLTDGKARCVPGVYGQLGSRGRVAVFAHIERDVHHCFADFPQFQTTRGSVLSLLQAYLTMVPDVQYTTGESELALVGATTDWFCAGLTLIAGQLLLLSPEEDAFWIFVSIMDTHLRSYFSSSSTQIDVDATLFGRALENADPPVAKKLLVDMNILPSKICRPWFTSLFVGSLPTDYLNRVWDIFLLEGVPFLIRVALALVSCCRRQILESNAEENILKLFQHPPQALLPTSADALITMALGAKLKDDDIRKQRVKMEAQVKRSTQAPRLVSTPGAISLPRS